MHILLTRPLEDCSDLIIKLKELGHSVSHLPLIKIKKMEYEETNFNDFAADGNVRALKELILQNHDKKDGKILYVSGELISFNLDKDLSNEGYEITRIINYSVEHNDEIKDDFIDELKKNIPDIVYVYSENSS